MFVGRRFFHPPLGDHMSQLDATEQDACAPETLEPEHGAGTPLDRAVVLFDDIVQILRLLDLDGRFALGIDGFQRSQIGAALVHGNRFGFTILIESRIELVAPATELLLGDHDTTLEQQLFDVAQAQAEPEIPPNRATDDDRKKAMAVVK